MKKSKDEIYSKGYAKNIFSVCDRFSSILEIIHSYKPAKILDFGCGDGSFSVELKKQLAADVYGIDISAEAIDTIKSKGIKGKVLDIDSDDIPYESNTFDCIFCGDVIEHVYSPDHMLEEFYRVLAPKGVLVLTTPNLVA